MTELEVVNRALTSLGSLPASSMADTAKNAARAVTSYDLCRDEMLRLIPWPSCVTRALLLNANAQARAWVTLTPYLIGDRVTADTLKTYRCTTAGVSGATGPTGTGSGITDGTVVWEYVEASTLLNNWAHKGSTAYVVGDVVASDYDRVYVCITAGTSAAATPPTGITKDITDGTAHWSYYATQPHNRTVYAYQYLYPPDCLRVLKIPLIGEAKDSQQGVQFIREGKWLYCDQDDSYIKYTRLEEDPDMWDELLQETVAKKIASEIAFDVTGKEDLAMLAFQKWQAAQNDARQIALGEAAEGTEEVVRWEDV